MCRMSGQLKDPEAYFDENCERRITLKHLAGHEKPGSEAQFISLDSVWKLVIDPNNWVGEGAEELQKIKRFQVCNFCQLFESLLLTHSKLADIVEGENVVFRFIGDTSGEVIKASTPEELRQQVVSRCLPQGQSGHSKGDPWDEVVVCSYKWLSGKWQSLRTLRKKFKTSPI